MQLLKITTTPIKYRVETERASFTLADSDNYDSSGVLQGGIKKVDATNNTAANTLKNEVSSSSVAQYQKMARQDKTFDHSGGQFSSYDVRYRYGVGNNVSQIQPQSDGQFISQKAVSIDRAFYEMDSLRPDESWEPEVKIQSESAPVQQSIDASPKLEFNPATYKFVVEELADVKIEYLGGFNYFPRSSAPGYEAEEDT
ncbi:MAG: hypothetical protein J6A58_01975 [Oscillospiraceae bacterium]|nr:hypothetical protein [Oscillospiraceae bacterium]